MAMSKELPRKADLTPDEFVHSAQAAWARFRDAQLHAFFCAAPLLEWARENEADFRTYCKRNGIGGDTHESRVVELMLLEDPDCEDSERLPTISRERRAEYAACIGWFADRELCPETDADKAVALARQKGRITGIAKAYREKKDAENPKLKDTKQKGQATKAQRANTLVQPHETVTKAEKLAAARSIEAAETTSDDAEDDKPVFLTRRNENGERGDPDDELVDEIIAAGKRVELPAEFDQLPGVALWLTVRKGTEVYAFGPIYNDRLIRAASIHIPMQTVA
jgi:hypothetical protein